METFQIKKLYRPIKKKKEIFEGPHILIEQSPKVNEKSFKVALLNYDAVFTQSLLGINSSKEDFDSLLQCCLVLNSQIPLYVALMSSSIWLVERDLLTKEEIMSFPLPPKIFDEKISYEYLETLSNEPNWEESLNRKIDHLYDLTEDEQILIEDAINYTLSYFRSKENSEAVYPTFDENDGEGFLEQYLHIAQRTLQNSFGTSFQSIIFQGNAPLRVVALKLITSSQSPSVEVCIESSQEALNQALEKIDQYLIEQRSQNVFIRRHVRAYIGKTIYLVKPDQRRYWTRANALHDADEIYADIMQAWRS